MYFQSLQCLPQMFSFPKYVICKKKQKDHKFERKKQNHEPCFSTNTKDNIKSIPNRSFASCLFSIEEDRNHGYSNKHKLSYLKLTNPHASQGYPTNFSTSLPSEILLAFSMKSTLDIHPGERERGICLTPRTNRKLWSQPQRLTSQTSSSTL